jgi:hypothetical protein
VVLATDLMVFEDDDEDGEFRGHWVLFI